MLARVDQRQQLVNYKSSYLFDAHGMMYDQQPEIAASSN
jgi:hypothetical protein